uniref:Uncharacterized protein n=1 Tax=viral metagenome TaxID=1070528 RepID=A0A6C0LWM9_9ZZZZ
MSYKYTYELNKEMSVFYKNFGLQHRRTGIATDSFYDGPLHQHPKPRSNDAMYDSCDESISSLDDLEAGRHSPASTISETSSVTLDELESGHRSSDHIHEQVKTHLESHRKSSVCPILPFAPTFYEQVHNLQCILSTFSTEVVDMAVRTYSPKPVKAHCIELTARVAPIPKFMVRDDIHMDVV